MLSVTGPDGATTGYAMAPSGQLGEITNAEGRRIVANAFDGAGRVIHQEFGSGGGVDIGYDDATGMTTVTARPSGAQTSYEHNPAGRAMAVTDAAGRVLRQTFDSDGRSRPRPAPVPGWYARLTGMATS